MTVTLPRTPFQVDIELTSRCNARCAYCYYLNNEGVRYEDVPTATWLAFFDELAEARVFEVTLAGGEPLMRPDFLELAEHLGRNNIRFSLLTNGWFVTPELAQALAAMRRCSSVQVSLDGSTAAIHERLRGPGTFAPAVRAIRTLQDAGLPTTVRVTVNAGNLDDLPALAHFLLAGPRPAELQHQRRELAGHPREVRRRDLPEPAPSACAPCTCWRTWRSCYPGRIQATAGPLAEWRLFDEMSRAAVTGDAHPRARQARGLRLHAHAARGARRRRLHPLRGPAADRAGADRARTACATCGSRRRRWSSCARAAAGP